MANTHLKIEIALEMGRVFTASGEEQAADTDPIIYAACHCLGLELGQQHAKEDPRWDVETDIKIAKRLFKSYIRGLREGAKEGK